MQICRGFRVKILPQVFQYSEFQAKSRLIATVGRCYCVEAPPNNVILAEVSMNDSGQMDFPEP